MGMLYVAVKRAAVVEEGLLNFFRFQKKGT